jgi:hypothetical protein
MRRRAPRRRRVSKRTGSWCRYRRAEQWQLRVPYLSSTDGSVRNNGGSASGSMSSASQTDLSKAFVASMSSPVAMEKRITVSIGAGFTG